MKTDCHSALTLVPLSDSQAVQLEAVRRQLQPGLDALVAAKKKSGEAVSGNLDSFSAFVKNKTSQIRKKYGCEVVEYSVELQDGQVKLKAKAKS